MSVWIYRVQFRHLLTDDDSPAAMKRTATGIARALKTVPIISTEQNRILADLRAAAKTSKVEWFNASLAELWDWLDANRIWVDFPLKGAAK